MENSVSQKDPGVVKRILKPTPKFFRKIRRFGLGLLGVSAAIASAASGGLLLPAAVIAWSGYIATAGAVSVAVSQMAVEPE
jgi:hypothetical protein